MADSWWKQPIPSKWDGVHRARLSVPDGGKSVLFYHHAKKLIRLDSDILDEILGAVNQEIEVVSYVRSEAKARRGVNPTAINAHIRRRLRDAASNRKGRQWTFEAVVDEGIIYDAANEAKSAKKGFDLARYDMRHNIMALRALCFGKRPLRNGQKHWDTEFQARPHWRKLMEELRLADPDVVADKEEPTVLGEIQFGVRTSLDHDLLRLLKARADLAKVDDEIDLYVYICPTEGLAGTLAGNTVNLEMVRKHLTSLGSVLPIPTIVVPMDLEIDPSGGDFLRPLSAEESANVTAVTHKRVREDDA